MELWIRSQNKGALIKVEMLGNTDGTITSYLGINQTVLGKYKSGERALEILNEIQNILSPKIFDTGKSRTFHYDEETDTYWTVPIKGFKNSDIQELSTYVYEMPNE